MKRALNPIGFVVAITIITPISGQEFYGEGIPKQCLDSAAASTARWKSQGRSQAEIEKLYQAALAVCSGASNSVASFVGTINVDFARLGRQLINESMSPSDYLQRMRDRSRKLRLARKDPTWPDSYIRGDQDGDLVPDDRDLCPGTADLAATDDRGCQGTARPPAAPSAREVARARDALGIMLSPACDGAPLPEVSIPIKAGYDNVDRSTFAIAVTKVKNQPVKCRIFYEVHLRFSSPTWSGLPAVDHIQVVFRSNENTDTSGFGLYRQVFRTREIDTGQRKRLFDMARYYNRKDIRVRIVNGNGLSKGWSQTVTATLPSFGEP